MRIDVRLVARSLAAGAVSAYDTGRPGWHDVNLPPALELAAGDGAQAAVLDTSGRVVASTLPGHSSAGGIIRRLLVPGGQRIGTLLVRFTGQGLAASANNLRS